MSARHGRVVWLAAALAIFVTACGRTASPPVIATPVTRPVAAVSGPPSGRLSGVVYDSGTGSPIEGARVQVKSPALTEARQSVTDREGRYEFGLLPIGLYVVTASTDAYVPNAFGYRRLIGTQATISLGDGEHRDRVHVRLTREAAITGRVLDEFGSPLARAVVHALRPHLVDGQRLLASFGSARTDAEGRFRVAGLLRGDYYVSAFTTTEASRVDATPRDAPTYYPGSADTAGARRVRVLRGAEVAGIDFGIKRVPWLSVAGSITSFNGKRLMNAAIIMQPHDAERLSLGPAAGAKLAADGSFLFERVPPGDYIIRALGETQPDAPMLFAAFVLDAEGRTLPSIALTLTRGAILSGRVRFESHGTSSVDLTTLRLYAPLDDGTKFGGEPKGRIRRDGSFQLDGVDAGARLIRASQVPDPWSLEKVTQRGRDITDVPINIQQGQRLQDVEIVFTDQGAWIEGTVRYGNGFGAVDDLVVAFPIDRSLWRPFSRQVRSARTDWEGHYRVGPLPPGQYLVVAHDDFEETEIYERETLDQISATAVGVTLVASQVRTQDLRADPPAGTRPVPAPSARPRK